MEGDAWDCPELGIADLRVHPKHLLDDVDYVLVELWRAWRGTEMGRGPLPFAGGMAEQPSCVMAAFGVMEDAAHKLAPPGRD